MADNTPMKKTPQQAGTFRPFRPGVDDDLDWRIRSVLADELWDEYEEFCNFISWMEVLSVSANKTGRKIHIRVRSLGRVVKLSLSPYQSGDRRPRTLSSVTEEIVGTYSRKPIRGAVTRIGGDSLVSLVNGVIRTKSERSAGYFYISSVLLGEVLDRLVRNGGGVDRVHKALTEFVRAGSHLENFSSHQCKKAVESFREMACHAFKHGATMDDLTVALQEEMVRATMET